METIIMTEQFVHLHNHSQFSLIDGRATVENYITMAEKDGQPAFALTDHGSISGTIELYTTSRKHNIKPILGSEIYIDHTDPNEDRARYPDHLTVLARGDRGYRDLVLATTIAAANFYYRPRIYFSEIEQNNLWSNWFILSGCKSSTLSKYLLSGNKQAAFAMADFYSKRAGGFALEVMPHDTSRELLGLIKELSKATGIPMVMTNDCHYLTPESENIYQNLLATGTDVRGIEFDGRGFHWRSTEEMYRLAEELDILDAARYTIDIANDCTVSLPEVDNLVWDVPIVSRNPAEEINDICVPKLKNLTREHYERYGYEMSVLTQAPHIMQSYLVAYNIINWCHTNGIPARCRGSMAGSIVSWLLGITRDDPIAFNLSFTRAVNPMRPTIPDFDLDVSSHSRQDVIQYILKHWPSAKPIVTFQEYGPRGATKTVLRAQGYEAGDMNIITKFLPHEWDENINWSVIPPELVNTIKDYQGLYNSMSIHAAGISLNTPSTTIPLAWIPSSKQFVAGFDMYSLKKIGNFKMDILGLATLDQIRFFEETTGVEAPRTYEDPEVFAALSTGKTSAIFQLDGHAARNCIQAIGGIRKFEDIVAVNALARPGSIQFADVYRDGETKYITQYPVLESTLGYSNGTILYQEQAMEIARLLASFDDLEQDEIKEATKYFRDDVFRAIEPKFLSRCKANGHDGQLIWDALKQFAGYSFNRAHAVSYAGVAYQLAWFKVHYPLEFYAGVFDSYEDRMRLIVESYSTGVSWKLPDINESGFYTEVWDGKIQLGLGTIKGIGAAVAREVMSKRPFTSYEDFEERVEKKKCNAKYKRLLFESGCFRNIGGGELNREAIRENLNVNPAVFQLEQFVSAIPRSTEYQVLAGFVSEARPTIIHKEGSKNYGKEMGIVKVLNSKGIYTASLFPEQWKKFKGAVSINDGVWFKGESDGHFFRVESAGIIN